MTQAELLQRINSFTRWHYQFDLQGHKTPIAEHGLINRHAQRRSYFFDPLVKLLGGSLAGKRVLDLGCNAAFWSLCAAENGCEYVLGIDGRPMHIEQANLVFEAQGIERSRYDFRCGDIFDVLQEEIGTFDIVLCLGLLYHVNKHVTLLEAIERINTDLLLIDTSLLLRPGALLRLRQEPVEDPRNACDYSIVMDPTRQAVLDMVRMLGYRAIVLKPHFSDYTFANDYASGSRRAFFCTKQTPLESLSVEGGADEECSLTLAEVREIPANQLFRALIGKLFRRVGVVKD